MNILKIIFNGFMRLTLNDIRWLQDGYVDAFNNILKEFAIDTNSNFIISGCNASINGGMISVTAGYIYLNGEVVKVDLQENISSFNPVDYWAILKYTSYDPAGLKLFRDGNSHDTYQKNRGVITDGTGSCPVEKLQIYPVINNRLSDKVLLSLQSKADLTWHKVGDTGEPAYQTSWGDLQTSEVKFRKDMNGRISLYGICFSDNPVQHSNLFILPAGYRPPQKLNLYSVYSKAPLVDSLITIHENGYIEFIGGELLNNNAIVCLDGISFVI